jgi:polyhydroxybutyrate depolymerase
MLWTGPAHADSDGPQTLTVGSQARTYVLAGAGSERRPLILAFHGGGSNGAAMAADTGLGEAAQRAGFVIAFVNGSGDTPAALTWNSGTCCGYARAWQADDVGYARALIAHLVASGQADPDRVYAVGMANGGMMAYRLAAESPELLRGVAVVAGTLDLPPTRIQTGVPVLHLHGTADDSVPYAGGIGAKAGTANGAPQPGIPVDSTIAAWVRANGVETAPTVMQLPAIAGDGTSVTRSVYATRTDPLAVVLYRINDGGHVWPGAGSGAANSAGGLTANGAIISFFQAHASAGQIGRFRKTTNARDPGSP